MLVENPLDSRPRITVTLPEIYRWTRMPLVVLFLSAGIWLLLASLFSLAASLQFHKPDMFANCPWFSYGRARPAANNLFLYGFCLQAGLGVVLWLTARLGRAVPVQPLLISMGANLWNLGVTIGLVGILAGDGTGFENFDMPRYAAPFLLLGFLSVAVFTIMTFHQRTVRELYVSQWYLLAALFWFAWIFSTAGLLLLVSPDRGMGQAVTTWWYSNNLQVVCLGLLGLGVLFYFILRLTRQNLRSRPLALLSFIFLMLLGSWGGIPNSAPVPAWLPTISTVATVLMIVPIIASGLNVYATTRKLFPKPFFSEPASGVEGRAEESPAILNFLSFALLAFLAFGALNANAALRSAPLPLNFAADVTDFTWFVPAKGFLNTYGFFAMAMFGAIYYIAPTLFPGEILCPNKVRIHFIFAAAGVVLTFFPLAIGGLVQGLQFKNPSTPFLDIIKHTLPFLRAETFGALLLLAGHIVFLLNVSGLAFRFYRARALRAYADATTPLAERTIAP